MRKYPKAVKILAMFVENGETQTTLSGGEGKDTHLLPALLDAFHTFPKAPCLHGCLGSDKMGRVASQSPWLVVLDKLRGGKDCHIAHV